METPNECDKPFCLLLRRCRRGVSRVAWRRLTAALLEWACGRVTVLLRFSVTGAGCSFSSVTLWSMRSWDVLFNDAIGLSTVTSLWRTIWDAFSTEIETKLTKYQRNPGRIIPSFTFDSYYRCWTTRNWRCCVQEKTRLSYSRPVSRWFGWPKLDFNNPAQT